MPADPPAPAPITHVEPLACVTVGCGLPAAMRGGLCAACTAVRLATVVLCERLGGRELARLEQTPGITAAIRCAIRAGQFGAPAARDLSHGSLDTRRLGGTGLARIAALVDELRGESGESPA